MSQPWQSTSQRYSIVAKNEGFSIRSTSPIFWRKAGDSAEKHGGLLRWLLNGEKAIILVHLNDAEIDGFIIADPSAVSPPFDRKGTSCYVDDFGVADETKWPIGAKLLYFAAEKAKSQGAVSTQVICGDADLQKRQMLEQLGYQIGHQWFTRATIGAVYY